QAEDGIRDLIVTGVQTCALPICELPRDTRSEVRPRHDDLRPGRQLSETHDAARWQYVADRAVAPRLHDQSVLPGANPRASAFLRSEERRVGKEWRSRWEVDL